jgi:hypothetical protein
MPICSKFLMPALGISGMSSVFAVGAVCLLTGCGPEFGPPGPERTETSSIPLDSSEEVRVDLRMGAGEMRVHGGASQLMEGQFSYNRLRLRPEISYTPGTSGGFRGRLLVAEPGHVGNGGPKYEWDLRFNDQKPLDLEVNCGAGESRLDLEDLTLRRVDIHMGVGKVTLDLRGQPKTDYSVRIRGGIGEATVYLPRNVGIEADVRGGIGDIHASGLQKRDGRYINTIYGHAATTVHLDIEGGIGDIRLIAD